MEMEDRWRWRIGGDGGTGKGAEIDPRVIPPCRQGRGPNETLAKGRMLAMAIPVSLTIRAWEVHGGVRAIGTHL